MSPAPVVSITGILKPEWRASSCALTAITPSAPQVTTKADNEYFRRNACSNELISPFLTTGVVASVMAMLLAGTITRYYDKIKMFRYTQLLTFVAGVAMYFVVGEQNIYLAFVFFFIITLLGDMQLPVYWASIAEAVDYGEVKTGTRVSGLAFGGILFFQKLGMGLAGGFMGFSLSFFGYQADVKQSPSSLLGITLMMTLIPSVFNLIVGLFMKKYVINDKYYEGIKQQLAQGETA